MNEKTKNVPKHKKIASYLKDMVYGANDGLVTTFAVIAGVAGASLDPVIVIFLGMANLLADGFSMAASSYLAASSESDVFIREKEVEHWEIANKPELEEAEIRDILAKKGYYGDDLDKMTMLVVKNKKFWIDLMMGEELGLAPVAGTRPLKGAIATFLSFVAVGFMPVAPFFFASIDNGQAFWLSTIISVVMFFVVGALRTIFTRRSWFWSGIEMFLVGGTAAFIAYSVGFSIKALIN